MQCTWNLVADWVPHPRNSVEGYRGVGHHRVVAKLDLVAEGPSHFFDSHNYPHSTMREPILPTIE
jgi:hypothetical protein